MLVYPDYYKKFKCIAGECRHSCCIGWQICIDDESFYRYMNCNDEYSDIFKANIDDREQSFVLRENNRCPFLNDENLCDIIINKGEAWLCEICKEHPRFRNYIGETEMVGLGLSCEEAARIILNHKEKTVLEGTINPKNETEQAYFCLQNQVISVLQNRKLSLKERFEHLEECFGVGLPHCKPEDIGLILKGLERLEDSWEKYLKKTDIKNASVLEDEKWYTAFEQLAVYFIYRYLPGGFEDNRYIERIAFAGFCVYAVALMFDGSCIEELEEISRRFSAEVEYCEENVEALLDIL